MSPFPYSIWLMPCAEQCETLRQTINSLAVRFEVPPFAPHVTLCSGHCYTEKTDVLDALEGLAAKTVPVELAVEGVGWTDHWASFFFLRLSGANVLFKHAAALFEDAHPPSVGPHLSLLYGLNAAAVDRAALRQEMAGSLPSTIRFDRLALVRPATGRWEDVNSWKILNVTPMDG